MYVARDQPIMLLLLPIMVCFSAHKFMLMVIGMCFKNSTFAIKLDCFIRVHISIFEFLYSVLLEYV